MHVHIIWALVALIFLAIGRATGFRKGQSDDCKAAEVRGHEAGKAVGFRDGMAACEGTIIALRNQLGRLKDREGLYCDRITDLSRRLYAAEQALLALQEDPREQVARRTADVNQQLDQHMAEAGAAGG